uniref:Peptidase_M14 domain-containing protein n=1 Tax=Heligmosomoides polygyrus TaxID=6339 RepID=A0A183GIF4_HELPZ
LLFQLAKRFPHMVDVWQVASSSEGRNIYAIKVMHCYLKDAAKRFSFAQIGYPSNTKKPILWIDAGIHAREWIAHSTALYIIWQVREVCHQKKMDIVVVPNTNPDGYEYSRKINRMWRKTSDQCSGVDGNRNYPFHFGEEGVSHWPCQYVSYTLLITSQHFVY